MRWARVCGCLSVAVIVNQKLVCIKSSVCVWMWVCWWSMKENVLWATWMLLSVLSGLPIYVFKCQPQKQLNSSQHYSSDVIQTTQFPATPLPPPPKEKKKKNWVICASWQKASSLTDIFSRHFFMSAEVVWLFYASIPSMGICNKEKWFEKRWRKTRPIMFSLQQWRIKEEALAQKPQALSDCIFSDLWPKPGWSTLSCKHQLLAKMRARFNM